MIRDDDGALTIDSKNGGEVWVEATPQSWVGDFEIGIDNNMHMSYLKLTRKELKAFRKAINRVLKESK